MHYITESGNAFCIDPHEDDDVPGVQLAQPVLMGLSCF